MPLIPVDAPTDVYGRVLSALIDELMGLKLRVDEASLLVELAESLHVLRNRRPLLPVGVHAILSDAGWLGIEFCDGRAIKRVEGISVALEEVSDLAWHVAGLLSVGQQDALFVLPNVF
jgi:hypothetical protein